MTKHDPNKPSKLKRTHSWRIFHEGKQKPVDHYNHRALPNTYNRPIKV